MLTASADSRLAAISNDVRVRVEASRKRLMTVLPRSVGTFLIGRSLISRNRSPRAITVSSSGAERGSIPRRWRGPNVLMARRSRSTTRSVSPRSDSITRTDSAAVVCTVMPTTSGWIGSSRHPRSTSAASFTARGRP